MSICGAARSRNAQPILPCKVLVNNPSLCTVCHGDNRGAS